MRTVEQMKIAIKNLLSLAVIAGDGDTLLALMVVEVYLSATPPDIEKANYKMDQILGMIERREQEVLQ